MAYERRRINLPDLQDTIHVNAAARISADGNRYPRPRPSAVINDPSRWRAYDPARQNQRDFTADAC